MPPARSLASSPCSASAATASSAESAADVLERGGDHRAPRRGRRSARLDRGPHPFGRRGHVDVARCRAARARRSTAFMTAGVDADRSRLADALDAHRFVGLGVTVESSSMCGDLRGRRHEVVGERSRCGGCRSRRSGLLPERLRDALHDAAVDLALDDERVDLVAAVVDRDVAQQLDAPGLLVDLDDRDVHAEREREVRAGRTTRPP